MSLNKSISLKEKRCTSCGNCISTSKFYYSKKDGFNPKCKTCTNQINLKWRIDNRERNKKSARAWNLAHPDRVRARKKKYLSSLHGKFKTWALAAKRRDILFCLDFKDLESMPLICHYTGKQLTLEINNSNTASLDRINSGLGYTRDNVVLCCSQINLMKNNTPHDEFIQNCKTIAERFK